MLNCEINGTVHFLKSHISAPGDRNSPICFPSWSFPVIFPCHNWFWSDEDNVSAPLGDVFLIKVHSFRQHIINTGRMTRLMVMTQLWNYVKLEVLDLVCILECSEFTTMNEWIYNVGIKLLGQLKSTILVFLNDWPPERWLQSQKKELPDHRSFRHPWHFELFITSEKYRVCHQHDLGSTEVIPKQILHFSPGLLTVISLNSKISHL